MKLQFDAHQQFQLDAIAAVVDLFDGHRKRKSILEKDLIEQIIMRAAIANMVDVQFKLAFNLGTYGGSASVPGLEVGLSQLEDAKTPVPPCRTFKGKLAGILCVQPVNGASNALLCYIGDRWIVHLTSGLWKLN